MKTTIKAFGVAVLLVVVFAAGYVAAVSRGWSQRTVDVQIINKSGRIVQSFKVRYTTCGSEAQITGGPLNANEARMVQFIVCGEGGYVVEATLANGTVVRGTDGYVQSGTTTTDVVTEGRIESTVNANAL